MILLIINLLLYIEQSLTRFFMSEVELEYLTQSTIHNSSNVNKLNMIRSIIVFRITFVLCKKIKNVSHLWWLPIVF